MLIEQCWIEAHGLTDYQFKSLEAQHKLVVEREKDPFFIDIDEHIGIYCLDQAQYVKLRRSD